MAVMASRIRNRRARNAPTAGAAVSPESHGFAVQASFTSSLEGRERERRELEMANRLRRANVDELISRVRDGERLFERDKHGLGLAERLAVQRVEREQLELFGPEERLTAYRKGRLSAYQLSIWWSSWPNEIPYIDGVPEWIAITLVDICEHPDYVERCKRAGVDHLAGKPQ
jgi:hypothetical protein